MTYELTYETLAHFAATWGLVFLVCLFLVTMAYALWPANRDKFERAAHLPLIDDRDETKGK